MVRSVIPLAAVALVVGSCAHAFAMAGGGGGHHHQSSGSASSSNSSTASAFSVSNAPNSNVALTGDPPGSSGGSVSGTAVVDPVPEPATMLLLASGTAGFVSWMRRRK